MNYVPGHHDFRAGDPVPLEEMRRLDRAAAGLENATVVAAAGAAGADGLQVFSPPPRLAFWARITGVSGNAYSFTEVQDSGGPSSTTLQWVPVQGGMQGVGAFEANNNAVPFDALGNGPVVWMVQSEANERWEFSVGTGAVNNKWVWTNIVIIATNVEIDVFQQFIWVLYTGPIIINPAPGTVAGPTGPPGPTGLPGPPGVYFNVPVKLDDWMYWGVATKTVTGADLNPVTNTWDNWIPGGPNDTAARRVVWKVVLPGGTTQLTGVVPAAPPLVSNPDNGQVLWLLVYGQSASTLLQIKHLSSNSGANNRIFCPWTGVGGAGQADLYVTNGGAVGLWYDVRNGYWRVLTVEAGGFTGTNTLYQQITFDPVTCVLSKSTVGIQSINGRIQSQIVQS